MPLRAKARRARRQRRQNRRAMHAEARADVIRLAEAPPVPDSDGDSQGPSVAWPLHPWQLYGGRPSDYKCQQMRQVADREELAWRAMHGKLRERDLVRLKARAPRKPKAKPAPKPKAQPALVVVAGTTTWLSERKVVPLHVARRAFRTARERHERRVNQSHARLDRALAQLG